MVTFGAGYTPAYLSIDSSPALVISPFVSHMEMGFAEYDRWISRDIAPEIALSLHLARTPVTESFSTQDIFIEHVKEKIKPNAGRLSSIGIHLIGQRNVGIGQMGFSSHFVPSQNSEKNSERFMEKLRERTGLPVWIENANFYSRCPHDIFEAWGCIDRLCRSTGAGLIVDLSHLLIDAKNNGISPNVILGAVPWKYVVEIHLSGVIEARDGSFHDGHSCAVHEIAWELLDECLNGIVFAAQPVVITIEHTDPCWLGQQQIYDADFLRLKNVVECKKFAAVKSYADQANNYAHAYLKKLLKQWIPQLAPACEQRGVSFDVLFDDWLDQVTQREGRRIAFTVDEVPSVEMKEVCIAVPEFLQFSKNFLAKC